jgi:hypothetical protein
MKTAVILGLATAWTAGAVGCGDKEAADDAPPAATTAETTENAADAEIEKALANLSPEDRELVVLMKDCPVSGEPLGSMGEPIKITKGGKSLFICCEGCREAAEKNFDDLIAKIEAKKAAAPASEPADAPAS